MNNKQDLINYLATHNKNYNKTQYYKILELQDIINNDTSKNDYYILVYIFMQELFKNDLLNIEELANKYTMTKQTIKTLKEVYNELYPED